MHNDELPPARLAALLNGSTVELEARPDVAGDNQRKRQADILKAAQILIACYGPRAAEQARRFA